MSEKAPASDPSETLAIIPTPCLFCGVTIGLVDPPPLTELCEHGKNVDRVFGEVFRWSTLQDGRIFVQIDMRDGPDVVVVLPRIDGEKMRAALARPGAAAMAEKWRP